MSDTEPRYYDPETGGSTTEARDLCMDNVVHDSFAARELARLQRELDEARGESHRFALDLDNERANHARTNAYLTTERAAREKAEKERDSAQEVLEVVKRNYEAMRDDYMPVADAVRLAAPVGDETGPLVDVFRRVVKRHNDAFATEHMKLMQARYCIAGLLNGMKYWGSQEDGIPEEAWDAFATGHTILGWALAEQPTALHDAGLVEDEDHE